MALSEAQLVKLLPNQERFWLVSSHEGQFWTSGCEFAAKGVDATVGGRRSPSCGEASKKLYKVHFLGGTSHHESDLQRVVGRSVLPLYPRRARRGTTSGWGVSKEGPPNWWRTYADRCVLALVLCMLPPASLGAR